MKLALGLFHFNPHWNADPRSGHRHCTETLAPLLASLSRHPEWRFSIEISGSGLEFILQAYPRLIELLRRLIDMGQVELISALYTPSIWVAFPRRDLIQAIRFNQACLDRLRLPHSKIFFAQEAFFGEGVATLQDYFEIAVCKDDYLSHYYDLELTRTLYTLRGMKVVVASSHLLNEICRWMEEDPSLPVQYALTLCHLKHLATMTGLNLPDSFPGRAGKAGATEWLWYHCGDGNHFGTIHKPDNLDLCFFDPTWNRLCVGLLNHYREKGFDFVTIGRYVRSLDYGTAKELPILAEGAWNPKLSHGVRRWMGENSTPYENDCGVLTAIARARCRLLAAETCVSKAGEAAPESIQKSMHEAWSWLLHAQISDGLGWNAGPQAAQRAILLAEQAFLAANQVLLESGRTVSELSIPPPKAKPSPEHQPGVEERPVEPVLFGAEGTFQIIQHSEGAYVCECSFEPKAEDYGIRFPFQMEELVYCPSAMETTPCRIALAELLPEVVTLPLANGLLQLSPRWFLVKDLQTVHIAAQICRLDRTVEFSVSGFAPARPHHWRFYLIRGTPESAARFANSINCCGASLEHLGQS
jgi:hypothetical protein